MKELLEVAVPSMGRFEDAARAKQEQKELLQLIKKVQKFELVVKDNLGSEKTVKSFVRIVESSMSNKVPQDVVDMILRDPACVNLDALELAKRELDGESSAYVGWVAGIRKKNPETFEEALPLPHQRHKVMVENLELGFQPSALFNVFSHFGVPYAAEVFSERSSRKPFSVAELLKASESRKLDAALKSDSHTILEEVSLGRLHPRNRFSKDTGSGSNPKNSRRSSVYGFVYFQNEQAMSKALSSHNQLFGLRIGDRMCTTCAPSSLAYIGNVGFRNVDEKVVEREFADLLAQSGQLTTAKSVDWVSRGSYVLQFENHSDADRAVRSLWGQTLLGRPLRIGFMSESEARRRRIVLAS